MSFSYNPFTDNLDYKATSSGGTVTSVTGTTDRITATGTTAVVIDIASTYIGQTSLTTLGTITTGVWHASIIPLAYGGTNANLTASNGGILYSTASAVAILAGTATAGQILMSGASTTPTWSTATYPATSGTSGKVLVSNGTNFVASTPTFPNASATAGKFIQSDGTNWVASTPTLPTTGGTSGTILRSTGTNFANTTATYPNTTTINQLLYSSAANAITGLSTGNNLILAANATGVPGFTSSFDGVNFTFTSTTGARTLTLSSTEATLSTSDAIFKILTNTTSGGSPYVMYVIQSATISYALGVDNTDSQSFKLSTDAASSVKPSTGTLLQKITSGGNRTLPLNSCVTADLTSDITNATGDGTYVTPVIFSSDTGAFFDQNSNYNTTTGLFTAPVTGKYLVTATVTFMGIGVVNTTGVVRIDLSGSTYAINNFSPYTIQDGNNTCSVPISCIIPANATNTIGITAQVAGGTKIVGIKGNFFGSFTRLSIVLVS